MTFTPVRADGPLAVSTRNPRYFTPISGPGAGRAVYLTGSHIWNNLHDGMGPGPDGPSDPERMDYGAYLRFLTERGHNFIRLWRWEQMLSQAAGGNYHLNMTPQPWVRTGPGTAKDGKPRFDLEQLDEGFFEGHPFQAGNNVNGISASSINDLQVLPLDPPVQALQEAYLRKVVDTVHDLPNVLWEVANEYGLIAGLEPAGESPAETGVPQFAYYEPARWAMGDTRRYAERMALIDMQPRYDIASTGYALASPGSEYLVLEPDGDSRAFTVDLSTGSYQVEWFDVTTRETTTSDVLSVESERTVEFSSPFSPGPAIVYLNRVSA